MKRKSHIGDKHPKPIAGRTIKLPVVDKNPTKKDKNKTDKNDKE